METEEWHAHKSTILRVSTYQSKKKNEPEKVSPIKVKSGGEEKGKITRKRFFLLRIEREDEQLFERLAP